MRSNALSHFQEEINEISKRNNDPDWLVAKRQEAFSYLKSWFDGSSTQALAPKINPLKKVQVFGANSGLNWSLPSDARGSGVIAYEFDTPQWSQIFGEYLFQTMKIEEGFDIAFHIMLTSEALMLYIPRKLKLKEPIKIEVLPIQGEKALLPHILIVADEESEISIVHNCRGEYSYLNQVVEIIAKPRASVEYAFIQELSPKSCAYSLKRARVDDKAFVQWINLEVGGTDSHSDTQSFLKGEGAEGSALVLLSLDGEQKLNTGLLMEHEGKRSTSDVLARGVLWGKAFCTYRVLSDILHGASDSIAYQKLKAALLSKEAKIHTVPGLEIKETQVQAGHSAGVSQVEEEQIFYLMSRGLSRKEATELIIEGFFTPVLEKITSIEVTKHIKRVLDRKMKHD